MSSVLQFTDIPSSDVSTSPYCFVCHLEIYNDANGSRPTQYTNGILITPNIVLTCGHSLHWFDINRKRPEKAKKIIIKPCGGKSDSFGTRTVIFGKNGNYAVNPNWEKIVEVTTGNTPGTNTGFFQTINRQYDYGLIKFQTPFSLDFSRYFDGVLLDFSQNDLSNTSNIEFCGTFRGKFRRIKININDEIIKKGIVMVNPPHPNRPQDQIPNILNYKADTDFGWSGAPGIVRSNNGKFQVPATHSFESPSLKAIATLYTASVFTELYNKLN
jgi:hypothetical protein